MDIQKPIWKIYLKPTSEKPGVRDLFYLFNEWIPGSPEVFIDVCDYSHLVYGPQVLLAGFSTDYVWDNTDKVWGLMARSKQPIQGNGLEVLQKTFHDFIARVQEFQNWFKNKGIALELDTSKIRLEINDRSLYPNRSEYLKNLKEILSSQFGQNIKFTDLPNPKAILGVQIQLSDQEIFALA